MPSPSTSKSDTQENPSKPRISVWQYFFDINNIEIEDGEREGQWNDLLDGVLLFAGIFASLLATFLTLTLGLLQPDPLDAIQDILLYQTLVMQNRTSSPYVAPVFSPPPYAVAVNTLFFASLGVVLLAAFLCMLAKGWVREFCHKLRGISDVEKRAAIKQLRDGSGRRWSLPELIMIIPSLIHLSLLLYFVGLAVYLRQIQALPLFLWIGIYGVGVVIYILSIFISTFDDFAPFQHLYSRKFNAQYCRLYSGLAKSFEPPLYLALPQTTSEWIREWMGTLIIAHEPLSQQAILDDSLSPSRSREVISRGLVPILNKIWSSINKQDTSAYTKNISLSILMQVHKLWLRPPQFWKLRWLHGINHFSIEEAECLAYCICMTSPTSVHACFVRAMRAVIDVLQQSSGPWRRLVASLTSVWVEGAERELSKGPPIASVQVQRLSIAARKEDILCAISDVGMFSAEEWCFVLSSIYVLFILDRRHLDLEGIRALTEILARILQTGLRNKQGSTSCPNGHTDFWLYVTMFVLQKETLVQQGMPMSEPKSFGEFQSARGVGIYGNGMTREPLNFRGLLHLSEGHNMDQSLMKQCLISILYILVSFKPRSQQQIRLVNQYIGIITEEMDVISWSLHLARLVTNENTQTAFLSQTVLCLLKGRFPQLLHPTEAASAIIQEYDRKLSAANRQLTLPILEVMEQVIVEPLQTTELELQNSWLSLHACNLTHSLYQSDLLFMWSPVGGSIASKRLDLYDEGVVAPEIDLITFFLSCPSTPITRRALRWYLRLREDAFTSDDSTHLIAIFPNIFRKGLSTDENRMTWWLLVDGLLPSFGSMSPQGKRYFVEGFFGYGGSQGKNQAGKGQSTVSSRAGHENVSDPQPADGLGWMEDVWRTVLRRLVVSPYHIKTYWPGLLRVMHATYPTSAQLTEQALNTSLSPGVVQDMAPEGAPSEIRAALGPKTLEEHLGDSAQRILEVLAHFLESGTGLMPAQLLSRVENSPLLSDPRLQNDTESEHRIRVILDQNRGGA